MGGSLQSNGRRSLLRCTACGAEVATVRDGIDHRKVCRPRFVVSEEARREELAKRVTRIAELMHETSCELAALADGLK